MKGTTPTVDETSTTTLITESQASVNTTSLRNSVREALRQYFIKLEGQPPANVFQMVIGEVEQPMIEMVLQYFGQNQSKTAKALNISRGTLRKKMAQYDLFKNKSRDGG